MFSLKKLQDRIKGSRYLVGEKSKKERLYFRFGKNNKHVKTTTFFEIVNDKLTPFVKVEDNRHPNLNNTLADNYKKEIQKQFHELIYNCELDRKKVPLHDRLQDDIISVYSDESLLHQVQALRFLCTMKVSALFADTGTGKTKIAIDLTMSRYEAGQIKKVLVFSPVSTKKNFRNEINKWCSNDSLIWKIVGHESMSSSDKTYMETLEWVDNETQIIVDESHLCKTPTARRSKRILNCCQKTSYKMIMTGTPTENVRDMYMQYALLSSLITDCRNWLQFEERFLIMGGYSGDEVIGYKNLDYLMGLIDPYTFQIRKEDCLRLPAKKSTLLICDLNYRQKELYEITKEKLLKEIEYEFITSTTLFRYLTILQQICCGFYRNHKTKEVEDIGSQKFELLNNTGYSDGQTIFFCKYLHEVESLIKFLGPEDFVTFTGQNPKERDRQKDQFTSGEKQYFVATMSSGGTGLNGLQGCQRIVFFSNSFRWTERKQCIGRIDRQGQTKEMQIFDTITESGIDHKIRQNLARKGNLADEIRKLLLDKTNLKKYVKDL